ncbi:hypothetical protein CAOG_03973 [Capsaspora owczarzaki ATCC 30864]|uniref:Uncharacterized protein n=1 Tax=Capsaspora owczarzaki (strain ATCC 30864) TaxID=595528 RepID=A0A0D2VQW3_CAPO3|nr:hypothetical protein CAOG_03973 [Capsaspora owczarzaki ATCC 30864]KJE93142.1 hypothetical protein, variant [Capsaspora owczarzaki ATCC 30864]|eukprot:XP_004347798.1 hypothetical protein CAOG_03973 [Capsaspora owczarzaki ATCC 30864]
MEVAQLSHSGSHPGTGFASHYEDRDAVENEQTQRLLTSPKRSRLAAKRPLEESAQSDQLVGEPPVLTPSTSTSNNTNDSTTSAASIRRRRTDSHPAAASVTAIDSAHTDEPNGHSDAAATDDAMAMATTDDAAAAAAVAETPDADNASATAHVNADSSPTDSTPMSTMSSSSTSSASSSSSAPASRGTASTTLSHTPARPSWTASPAKLGALLGNGASSRGFASSSASIPRPAIDIYTEDEVAQLALKLNTPPRIAPQIYQIIDSPDQGWIAECASYTPEKLASHLQALMETARTLGEQEADALRQGKIINIFSM